HVSLPSAVFYLLVLDFALPIFIYPHYQAVSTASRYYPIVLVIPVHYGKTSLNKPIPTLLQSDPGGIMTAISELISSLEQRVDPLSREICEVYWQLANTGNEELHQKMVDLEMGMHAIFSDSQTFQLIRDALEDSANDGETRRV